MQHTSRKGPRAACSQPSWFERDDLHLRDERVERPSFVGVGQKSSCIVSYTAAAAPRRRAFFMGRVLRDFAVFKKRLQCQLRNSAASEFSRCGRRRALTRFEAARRRRPVPLLPHRRRRGWQLTRAQAEQSLRSPQSAPVMSSTARRSCHVVTGRAAGSSWYAPNGGRGQLSRQRRTLVTCVLVRVVRREELRV